jgi:hypothetical protein
LHKAFESSLLLPLFKSLELDLFRLFSSARFFVLDLCKFTISKC